jgi:hypothetical protein
MKATLFVGTACAAVSGERQTRGSARLPSLWCPSQCRSGKRQRVATRSCSSRQRGHGREVGFAARLRPPP